MHKIKLLQRLKTRKGIIRFIKRLGLDSEKVGDKFAKGGQHNLYHYGEDKVIKLVKPDFLHIIFGIHSKKEVLNELKYLKKFFPKNLVETKVLTSEEYPYYLILQNKIEVYKHLSSYNLRKYKKNFLELLEINNSLIKKGYALDLFGRHGLKETFLQSLQKRKLFLVLYNLIVSEKKILIIDSNLLRINKRTERNFFKRSRFKFLNLIYMKLIKIYFSNL